MKVARCPAGRMTWTCRAGQPSKVLWISWCIPWSGTGGSSPEPWMATLRKEEFFPLLLLSLCCLRGELTALLVQTYPSIWVWAAAQGDHQCLPRSCLCQQWMLWPFCHHRNGLWVPSAPWPIHVLYPNTRRLLGCLSLRNAVWKQGCCGSKPQVCGSPRCHRLSLRPLQGPAHTALQHLADTMAIPAWIQLCW